MYGFTWLLANSKFDSAISLLCLKYSISEWSNNVSNDLVRKADVSNIPDKDMAIDKGQE